MANIQLTYAFRRAMLRPPNNYRRFLYKFHPASNYDHLYSIIVHSEFWLASVADFDDPFDGKATFYWGGTLQQKRKVVKRMLENAPQLTKRSIEHEITKLMLDPTLEERINTSYKNVINNYGVISFAENRRSNAMWSHYARKHEGICFQYNIFKDFDTFRQALPVLYDDSYPRINYCDENIKEYLRGISTKHSSWQYESERRICLTYKKHTYMPFIAGALESIIYGYKVKPETIKMVQSLLQKRDRLKMPLIKQYYANISNTAYKVSIHSERQFIG